MPLEYYFLCCCGSATPEGLLYYCSSAHGVFVRRVESRNDSWCSTVLAQDNDGEDYILQLLCYVALMGQWVTTASDRGVIREVRVRV